MADRIQSMRKALVDNLKDLKNPRSWKHITDQIGMFAYSGLSRDEVKRLREHHVCIKLISHRVFFFFFLLTLFTVSFVAIVCNFINIILFFLFLMIIIVVLHRVPQLQI